MMFRVGSIRDQIGDVVIFVKTEDELVDIEYSLFSNLKQKLRIYLYYQN